MGTRELFETDRAAELEFCIHRNRAALHEMLNTYVGKRAPCSFADETFVFLQNFEKPKVTEPALLYPVEKSIIPEFADR